ncbi:MAG: hypothetical protein ABFD65_14075 [Candidatus Polarisedimenticolia bacterium]
MDELPEWAIDLFERRGDDVAWIDEAARGDVARRYRGRDAARIARKSWPFGALAGARPIHGRGRLVMLAGRQFTTSDILAALADGGRWPWQAGGSPVHGVASPDDAERLASVRACAELRGDVLSWRISPHSTIPAGAPVQGVALCGGRRVMMRCGVGYLTSDVEHALRFGDWPWRDMRGTHGGYVLAACVWD